MVDLLLKILSLVFECFDKDAIVFVVERLNLFIELKHAIKMHLFLAPWFSHIGVDLVLVLMVFSLIFTFSIILTHFYQFSVDFVLY